MGRVVGRTSPAPGCPPCPHFHPTLSPPTPHCPHLQQARLARQLALDRRPLIGLDRRVEEEGVLKVQPAIGELANQEVHTVLQGCERSVGGAHLCGVCGRHVVVWTGCGACNKPCPNNPPTASLPPLPPQHLQSVTPNNPADLRAWGKETPTYPPRLLLTPPNTYHPDNPAGSCACPPCTHHL